MPGVCSARRGRAHVAARASATTSAAAAASRSPRCAFWQRGGPGAPSAAGTGRRGPRRPAAGTQVDRTRCMPRSWPPPRCIAAIRPALDEYVGATTCASTRRSARVSGARWSSTRASTPRWRSACAVPPGLDLRVVHVVRDSRAVAYSWTRRVSRPDSAAASYMTTLLAGQGGGQWNVQNQRAPAAGQDRHARRCGSATRTWSPRRRPR